MGKKIVLLTGIVLLLLSGCVKKIDDEAMRKKEMIELEKMLNSTELSVYKTIKIILRASYTDSLSTENNAFFKDIETTQRITKKLINKSLEINDDDKISLSEYIIIAKELHSLKKSVINIDEDILPTVFSRIIETYSKKPAIIDSAIWNNTYEHIGFYLLLELTLTAPKSFSLYEISKINCCQLPYNEINIAALLLQAVEYMNNDWNYLAEYSANQAIEILEKSNTDLFFMKSPLLFENSKLPGKEAVWHELHAISSGIRAMARFNMDNKFKQKQAIKDLESFLSDTEELGAENEIVWMVGSIVYTRKGEKEKAINYLTKLEKSTLLSENEKQVIQELKQYINNRKEDVVIKTITDKLFFTKITLKYFYIQIKNTKWYQETRTTKPAIAFEKIPEIIKEEYQKNKEYMDIKSSLKNIFSANEEGQD